MSNYTKERNIVIIKFSDTNGSYRLDIETGILYGIKGSPIKTCPRRADICRLLRDGHTNLEGIVYSAFCNNSKTAGFKHYTKLMLIADKIDALGFPNLNFHSSYYEYLDKNMKLLSAWGREKGFRHFDFREFKMWCEFEKAKNSLGSLANSITPEMYYTLVNSHMNLTIEEMSVCVYYLGRGKFWEYHRGDMTCLYSYIEMCRMLEKTPQKVNNFMREYCETLEYYKLRKIEFDNKKMAENYAKQSKAWEFEFGDYRVVIPTSCQDIVTEGQEMHHCVGSYVNRVLNNDCYICFVRRKDTPEQCYITCQVYTNGTIGQYFLAYDNCISSDEDREFKREFQEYLDKVWEN